jgi:hypothetical protein
MEGRSDSNEYLLQLLAEKNVICCMGNKMPICMMMIDNEIEKILRNRTNDAFTSIVNDFGFISNLFDTSTRKVLKL